MQIIQSFITNNPYYKKKRIFTPKGLMLHSVGAAQPSAQVFINQYNKSTFNAAAVHGFIDANTGIIYQTAPWNYRLPHCGGSANNTHIGIEMCEPSAIKYTGGASFTCTNLEKARASATIAYNTAVELFASLCKQYNLNPLGKNVIISHYEGYTKGLASGHMDPNHLWKGLGMTYTMDTFRNDVFKAMNPIQIVSINFEGEVYNTGNSQLNVRTEPNTNSSILAKLNPYNKVCVTGKTSDNAWYKIKTFAEDGYVISQYIKEKHWCDEFRDGLFNKGIITDRDEWSKYTDAVSRALTVQLISNIVDKVPVLSGSNHWADNAVDNLYKHKIITDKTEWSGSYLDLPISKALVLALIDNATGGMDKKYKNREADHWGRNHLDSLADKGIITTPESWIDFDGQVQKDILLAIIYKSLDKIKK